MAIEIKTNVYGIGTYEIVKQVEACFEKSMRAAEIPIPILAGIAKLVLSPSVDNPVCALEPSPRRYYDKATGTYFIDAPVDFQKFVSPDWSDRISAVVSASKEAVGRIAKTRITDEEPEQVSLFMEQIGAVAERSPPETLERASDIYVVLGEDGNVVSAGVRGPFMDTAAKIHKVAPEDAVAFASKVNWSNGQQAQLFKLYLRQGSSLHYREAWSTGETVTEHKGKCGERGGTVEHSVRNVAEAKTVMNRLKKEWRSAGYRSIAPSKHATLVLEYPIEGEFGSGTEIDRRHKIEDLLNEEAGWLGLGHCDGGSSGGGTMEVFLEVVDYKLAEEILRTHLQGTIADGYTRMYRGE